MLKNNYNQSTIVIDHVIEVCFTKDETDTSGNTVPTPITDEDIAALKTVTVRVEGGPVTVTEGNAIVSEGGSTGVVWKLLDPDNYEIESVTVNDVPVTYNHDESDAKNPYSFNLDNITADQKVVIKLKMKNTKADDTVIPPTITRTTYDVTTAIKGKGGSISNGGSVVPGSSKTVTWTLEEGAEVRYVFVNGEPRPDLLNAREIKLSDITENQSVIVYLAEPGAVPPTNVDKDGDNVPDINIDKDNDGIPDIDIDTDDDGKPDVNIDTDGDGEPNVNIDEDGDLVPDKNIDTDGDGIPDYKIIDNTTLPDAPSGIGSVKTGDVDLSFMLLVMLASAAGLALLLSKKLRMGK